jgi:hypothetical protein
MITLSPTSYRPKALLSHSQRVHTHDPPDSSDAIHDGSLTVDSSHLSANSGEYRDSTASSQDASPPIWSLDEPPGLVSISDDESDGEDIDDEDLDVPTELLPSLLLPATASPSTRLPRPSTLANFEANSHSHQHDRLGAAAPAVQHLSEVSETDPSSQIYHSLHSHWAMQIFLVVVASLHTQYQASFRACRALLYTLTIVFTSLFLPLPTQHSQPHALASTTSDGKIPMTLQTLFRQLNIQDSFTVYPVCHCCSRIYAADSHYDAVCTVCDIPLYQVDNRALSDELLLKRTEQHKRKYQPFLQAPF